MKKGMRELKRFEHCPTTLSPSMKKGMRELKRFERENRDKMKSFNVKMNTIMCHISLDKCASKINPHLLNSMLFGEYEAIHLHNLIKTMSLKNGIDISKGCLHKTTAEFIEKMCTLISLALLSKDEDVKEIAKKALKNVNKMTYD